MSAKITTDMNHTKCAASTGIHETSDADGSKEHPWGLTFGQGGLDENGYWSNPCLECARLAEKWHGVVTGSYWPWSPSSPLTTETAYRLRYEQGLKLPVTRSTGLEGTEADSYIPSRDDVQYEDEKVRKIAERQRVAWLELERLDRELKKLYLKTKSRIGMKSFCESVTATGSSPWCVRIRTDKGPFFFGGGVDTESLCGRVRVGQGWDLNVKFDPDSPSICLKCKELLDTAGS